MSEYQKRSGAMDWDSPISNDGQEFIILPEGDYVFTVTNMERKWYDGSAKLGPCSTADLTLKVETAEGTALIQTRLFLDYSVEWRISAFMRCIGQKKRGEELKPRWNEVVGSSGIAHFKPRSYTGNNGQERQANDVARWIDYDPVRIKSELEKRNAEFENDEDIPF